MFHLLITISYIFVDLAQSLIAVCRLGTLGHVGLLCLCDGVVLGLVPGLVLGLVLDLGRGLVLGHNLGLVLCLVLDLGLDLGLGLVLDLGLVLSLCDVLRHLLGLVDGLILGLVLGLVVGGGHDLGLVHRLVDWDLLDLSLVLGAVLDLRVAGGGTMVHGPGSRTRVAGLCHHRCHHHGQHYHYNATCHHLESCVFVDPQRWTPM